MKILGTILARGGSKGLANKHLLPLLGQPVISYTFEHVRDANLLSHVIVTSDSPAILECAENAGLQTVLRPEELATDTASVQDVMLHALDHMEATEQLRFDAVVILYGNVAARGQGVIDRAIELWKQTGCDSVRSFCPVGKWHPRWMSRLHGDRVEALHAGSIHRRQDLEPLWLHDGAVVVMSREALMLGRERPNDPHAMFGEDRRGIPTHLGETVEIDALRDLYWAEAVLRERGGQRAH